jgi:hypothetical protein
VGQQTPHQKNGKDSITTPHRTQERKLSNNKRERKLKN